MVDAKIHVPALPLKVKQEEAEELVQDELDANNWEIELPNPTIELRPYYVFEFDSFSETEEEGTKIRNVEEAMQGTSALNAVKNALDEVIAETASPDVVLSEFVASKEIEVDQKIPRFSLEDAKVAAQIKIAAQEKIPKANVHIHGIRLVYVPFWKYTLELDEDTKVTLKINGFTGEFEGEESGIPYHGKTRSELLSETIGDLKSPQGWLEYLSNFAKDVILLFQPDKEHPNRRFVILVLLVIAIALLVVGFIKLPTPQ